MGYRPNRHTKNLRNRIIMKIPEEIRTKIAEMDQIANELKEWYQDQPDIDSMDDSEQDIDYFIIDVLDELQGKITEIQENQGWI